MTTRKTLSREQARRVYDRIGRLQDSQAFYEDRATGPMIEHGRFDEARRVFELGCGTGRLARRLLAEVLPADATYTAVDVSPQMVRLAEEQLAPFGARAAVRLCDGSPPAEEPDGAYDRFVSTFVLDLLSEDDIVAVLREAHRMLEPQGLLCLASLSKGTGAASRLVIGLWSALHRLSPVLVGGCRALELTEWLPASHWRVRYRGHVAPFAVPLETVVAERV